MSIIFGVYRADRESVEEQYLLDLKRATARYASSGTSVQADGRLGMAFQPHYTHERSYLETQPAIGTQGNILTFDGRLDNYKELQHLLGMDFDGTADSFIVLAAFERWSEQCFNRFVGDWALALWSALDNTLYLARDHAGTRTLYFEQRSGHLLWSTCLETLLSDAKTRKLDMEYAACYLAGRPIRDRTPYRSIRAVPPAHFVRIREDRLSYCAHWNWMVENRIHYNSDKDYESHFLGLFGQAVARRTGRGAPTIAELSGGMDSTSIVCMSDVIRRSRDDASAQQLLDTLSYFNDLEPAWNEKPYFSLVEQRRGRPGIHIDTTYSLPTYEPPTLDSGSLLPGADSSALERERYLESIGKVRSYCLGYRR